MVALSPVKGVEVETVTVDSLGRFRLVKMDIEGAEGEIIRKDSKWLNYVRAMAMEVHGKENLSNIPMILTQNGFNSKGNDKI